MKRTIVALATVIAATLIYQHSEKVVASNSIPPSLIGVWKRGDDDIIGLHSDGSYYEIVNTFGAPGGAYNQCSTVVSRTTKGNFTVNGDKIAFRLKTLSVEKFAACGGFLRNASAPKYYTYPDAYIVDSFSLQNNGQAIVFKQTGGNVTEYSHGIYQKSRS